MTGPDLVVFRVDASLAIGTGHAQRCLTLADALSSEGFACRFICRDLEGSLVPLIRERGFPCDVLDRPRVAEDDRNTAHSAWLSVSQKRDAEDCLKILGPLRPVWTIVDHYALDRIWEEAVRQVAGRLMVIDDLADRPHSCDLLLDQNVGRDAADYDALVHAACRRLAGPRFALLRQEFGDQRGASLDGRRGRGIGRLLVSLGGVDKDNATGRVLDGLAACALPAGCKISVVLGRNAPWKAEVAARAHAMPVPTELKVDVARMSELMVDADLAIGAAGSSALERCCLGLPSLLVSIASNQDRIAAAFDAVGAGEFIGNPFSDGFGPTLCKAIDRLADPATLRLRSERAAAVLDGKGVVRVVRTMMDRPFTVRRATIEDARSIYDWRYAGAAPTFYRHTAVPAYEDHLAWVSTALQGRDRDLLIVEHEDRAVAHVRLDRDPEAQATAWVSVCLDPAQRGRGLSGPALQTALEYGRSRGIDRFLAEVHRDNGTSRKLFQRLGFTELGAEADFISYVLGDRPGPA